MATVVASQLEQHESINTYVADLTTIVAGQNLDITLPASLNRAQVKSVLPEVIVRATDGSPAFVSHIVASDVSTAATSSAAAVNTVRIVVDTLPGGSLTGMTLRLHFRFRDAARGGLATI